MPVVSVSDKDGLSDHRSVELRKYKYQSEIVLRENCKEDDLEREMKNSINSDVLFELKKMSVVGSQHKCDVKKSSFFGSPMIINECKVSDTSGTSSSEISVEQVQHHPRPVLTTE